MTRIWKEGEGEDIRQIYCLVIMEPALNLKHTIIGGGLAGYLQSAWVTTLTSNERPKYNYKVD